MNSFPLQEGARTRDHATYQSPFTLKFSAPFAWGPKDELAAGPFDGRIACWTNIVVEKWQMGEKKKMVPRAPAMIVGGNCSVRSSVDICGIN